MKLKVVLLLRAAEDELLNPAVEGQQSREIWTVGTDSSFVDGHHRGYFVACPYCYPYHSCDYVQHPCWNEA
jgi:hypothetical protein